MLADARWLAVTTPPPDRSYSAAEKKRITEESQRELLWQWQQALGVSRGGGLWLKRATSRTAVEVLKYSVKPADLCEAQYPLAPMLRVLAVSRLITSWGTVRKEAARLAKIEREDNCSIICPCGSTEFIPEILTPRAEVRDRWRKDKERAESDARRYDITRTRRDNDALEAALATAVGSPWVLRAGQFRKLVTRRDRAAA
jgi:hypothetical protein